MNDLSQYPFEIHPLSAEDGGGFLISFPDFSECISDGDTPEEAIKNGLDALQETIAALESMNLPVPEPGSQGSYSGKFIQRVPQKPARPAVPTSQARRGQYEHAGQHHPGRKSGAA